MLLTGSLIVEVGITCFENKHRLAGVFAESIGEDETSGSATDNDIVEGLGGDVGQSSKLVGRHDEQGV